LGWYIVLIRNNSYWVFSEPEKQVFRFAMTSRSKSFTWSKKNNVKWWIYGAPVGYTGLRRDPSITRGGLDADQWCVRLSMRSPTVYGKKICGAATASTSGQRFGILYTVSGTDSRGDPIYSQIWWVCWRKCKQLQLLCVDNLLRGRAQMSDPKHLIGLYYIL
jgi:hypothetical protein